jgi:glycosyltransferase involved in cell wall biosynthesis
VTNEMTNMRVLHVAPTAFGASGLFGGGERYPLELARALSRRGDVDCTLLTFGRRECETVDDSGLTVRTVRALAHLGGHPAHPVAPALVGALWGADVVHVHHLRSLPARIVAATSLIRRRPVVVTDHGLAGSDWLGLLPRLFDRSLAVSAYSESLLRFPSARSRVVYGGADPDRFRPGPAADRTGVLFVGRLTPHKGVDRLLAALPEGADLTIAGTGGHDARWPESGYVDHLRPYGSLERSTTTRSRACSAGLPWSRCLRST